MYDDLPNSNPQIEFSFDLPAVKKHDLSSVDIHRDLVSTEPTKIQENTMY